MCALHFTRIAVLLQKKPCCSLRFLTLPASPLSLSWRRRWRRRRRRRRGWRSGGASRRRRSSRTSRPTSDRPGSTSTPPSPSSRKGERNLRNFGYSTSLGISLGSAGARGLDSGNRVLVPLALMRPSYRAPTWIHCASTSDAVAFWRGDAAGCFARIQVHAARL